MAKFASTSKPGANTLSLEEARTASTLQLVLTAAQHLNPIESPLPAAQRALLPYLNRNGTRVSHLATQLRISKQAVSQAVDAMQDAGLVTRVDDPSDGRAKLVRLSDRGASIVLHELAALQSLEDQLVDMLGAKPMNRLRKALQKLLPYLTAEKIR